MKKIRLRRFAKAQEKKNLGAHSAQRPHYSAHSTVRMRPMKSAITWEGAETYLHAYQNAPFNNKIVYYTVRHQLYAFKHFMTG